MKSIVLLLDMTNDCNLFCKYCYISGGEKKEIIDIEDAIMAIEKTYQRFKCRINAVFHGGEPLITFDRIKAIIDKIEMKDFCDQVYWYMQTNAIAVNEDIAKFVKEKKIGVGVSIDGYNDISNGARVYPDDSFSTAQTLKGMQKLLDYDINLSILSVINTHNWSSYVDDMQKFVEMGITSFTLNPYINAGRGKQAQLSIPDDDMFEAFKKIADYIINYNNSNEKTIFEKNLYYIMKKIKNKTSGYMCMSSPCGAGLAHFTVDPNGDLYPCADFCGEEQFKIGNINDNDIFNLLPYNDEWIKIRSSSLENLEDCRICSNRDLCPAGCSVRSYYNNGDVSKVDPVCNFYKKFIPYSLENNLVQKFEFAWTI